MRLTLRTLLAYMDDILEPGDHEELGKKIEASDFATELIHRSRDTVRRLRLSAPAVVSEGSDDVLDGLDLGDANSVAEYLDNTLPPEQVAEFERMCLEPGVQPDMHLAEVASCHHVLTMVLGEPADVGSDLKSRMYKLPEQLSGGKRLRIESAHVAAPPMPGEAPPAPTTGVSAASPTPAPVPVQPASQVESELPDYLREAAAAKRKSRNWAIAMILLVGCGIAFWLAKPGEPEVPSEIAEKNLAALEAGELEIEGLDLTGGGVGIEDDTAGDTANQPAPPFESDAATQEPAPAFNPSTAGEPAPAFNPGSGTSEPEQAVRQPAATVDANVDLDLPTEQVVEPTDLAGEAVVSTPEEGSGTVNIDAPPAIELPSDIEAGSSTKDQVKEPALVASTPEQPMPSEMIPDSSDTKADPEPVQPAGPKRLGNYLGNDDVLLIYNGDQDNWVRLPPRSAISTGDVLLTLPKYFTHVVLADVNTYLSGGTRIQVPVERFEAATLDTALNVEVVYGRAMFNAGIDGSRVAVKVDDQLREFKLDSSASLAIDVKRMFIPGADYENQAAPTIATWYLTSGSVQWPTASGGTQTIRGQMIWKTMDGVDEIPEPLGELPEWIGREPMTDMERSAREDLSRELAADSPVEIRLMELTDGKGLGRRREVRVLAAASSVYIGEFEPLVKALNDGDQGRAWDKHIQELRQAMALSPDVAASVRQAFVNIRGEEAADHLFAMVVGYNTEQVGDTREPKTPRVMPQLLKWLDHDSLDYRVLAINNIKALSGKDKGYRADDSMKSRKKNLRKLWTAFESNELMPSSNGL